MKRNRVRCLWLVCLAVSYLPAGSACSKESAEYKRAKAEVPAFQSMVRRVLANDPFPLTRASPEHASNIAPQPCSDGELIDQIKGEHRDAVLVYVHDLRVLVGGKMPEDGPHSAVSRTVTHQALESFRLAPSSSGSIKDYQAENWVKALDLVKRRPWLIVFWPKFVSNGKLDQYTKTYEGAYVSGLLAAHDPESGKPLCWSELIASNSGKLVGSWDGRSSNMIDQLMKNLRAAIPESLAKLSRVLRVPEHQKAKGEAVKMSPEDQTYELLSTLRERLVSPILRHARDYEPTLAKCDDAALTAATKGRDPTLLIIDQVHLFKASGYRENPDVGPRKWMASPALAGVQDRKGGPDAVKARLAAVRKHRYLGVFKTQERDKKVPPGHLVVYDIDTAKHVCTTGPIAPKGKNAAARRSDFRARAAEALAGVTAVLKL